MVSDSSVEKSGSVLAELLVPRAMDSVDIEGMMWGDKLQVGVSGYIDYLTRFSKPPDIVEEEGVDLVDLSTETDEKLSTIREELAWVTSQRERAVRTGEVLKASISAHCAVETQTRLTLEAEQAAKSLSASRAGAAGPTGPAGSMGQVGPVGVTPRELGIFRDELRILNGIHRGFSLVYIAESLAEWRIHSVRMVKFLNTAHELGYVCDAPPDEFTPDWSGEVMGTNVASWKTSNPVFFQSKALLQNGNHMGRPLLGPISDPLAVTRRLMHGDLSRRLNLGFVGAITSLAIATTESGDLESRLTEVTDSAKVLVHRDSDKDILKAAQAMNEWLEAEATKNIDTRGGGVKEAIRDHWASILAVVLVAILAVAIWSAQGPMPGPLPNVTNHTGECLVNGTWITNNTVCNGSLIICGLLVMFMGGR